MSLYIGKDTSDNSVLHVTHGISTISELASGPLNNTVFHSDLKYITCDRYTGGSSYVKYVGMYAPNDAYIANASAGDYIYITPPNDFLTSINGTQTAYIIVINGYAIHRAIVNLPGLFTWGSTESGVWNANGLFPSLTNPMTCTRYYPEYSNPVIEFYIINFVNGAYIRPVKSSNSISVSKEEGIIVGGINISEVNFLANTITNPIDFKFKARSFNTSDDSLYVQVLNSYNNTNKPVTITSSAESTKLLTADYTILDSSQGDIHYSYVETITTIINAINITGSIDILEQIGSGFNDDDIFAMSLFIEGWYSSYVSSYLTVFKYKTNQFITGVPIAESFVYNGYRAYIFLVGGVNGELYLRTILNYYKGSGSYKKRTINVYKFS